VAKVLNLCYCKLPHEDKETHKGLKSPSPRLLVSVINPGSGQIPMARFSWMPPARSLDIGALAPILKVFSEAFFSQAPPSRALDYFSRAHGLADPRLIDAPVSIAFNN